VRFHGHGEAILPGDPRFAALLEEAGFEDPSLPEARRSIIVVDVARVSDSCGYGVPLMSFEGLRNHHELHTAKALRTHGPASYEKRRREENAVSLDGLPAFDNGR
jgi:hypothetical protein